MASSPKMASGATLLPLSVSIKSHVSFLAQDVTQPAAPMMVDALIQCISFMAACCAVRDSRPVTGQSQNPT